MPLKLTSYYHGKDIPELPGKDIFHSKDLFLFYEATSSYTPMFIVASREGKPVAKLLAVIRKNAQLLPFPFLKRCEVFGTGECLDDSIDKEETFNYMLEHLTTEALRHASIIEFRNLEHALDGHKYFRANKYFAINWLRVRNSLHKIDKVEDQISPSRVRQIKKGLKNGAEVYETNNMAEISEFSRMLHKIYSARVRKYFPTLEFFQLMNTWLISKGFAKIFVVKYKGRIIGGSSTLYSGGNAYLWFSGGMTKRFVPQYPGVLAIWAALADAKFRGCSHMEFVDVGLPFRKHGFRNFILRFGGKQSSTRRWFRIRWNFLNNFFIKIYA
ncbi:GNAT family N-acetyltransferase [Bacteroides sp. 51]|uniref:GNAT family N-acetyltransferase n=1 Tax=Bacteroides sp. 51 TaxID=2302938 RepID=UPI0013D47533|nr:GNAT family N-acetyltransferase [Bacteroides sp. 51]NDV84300.1 GNAT family N-acetyltransferase [Bacteroides sp. 51]